MKSIYSSLVALVVFVVFAAVALADPGTTWEKQIDGKGRFEVLSQFGGAAVFDKETGRVWEQSPSTSTFTYFGALGHCYQLQVGGRKGWRLPTIEELASLVDTSNSSPALPTGHPFKLTNGFYWSATTDADITEDAWGVFSNNGSVEDVVKNVTHFVLCVRGGQGIVGPPRL